MIKESDVELKVWHMKWPQFVESFYSIILYYIIIRIVMKELRRNIIYTLYDLLKAFGVVFFKEFPSIVFSHPEYIYIPRRIRRLWEICFFPHREEQKNVRSGSLLIFTTQSSPQIDFIWLLLYFSIDRIFIMLLKRLQLAF